MQILTEILPSSYVSVSVHWLIYQHNPIKLYLQKVTANVLLCGNQIFS